ncbi:MAG: formate dehydrogenase accessory sulfurtransferase FdhD [Gammaproteobacteria bacterium]|nr:formate dehydrogenase accessory sulfurtransferase FdhD [Gammaproteobacteria bacterium]
MSEVMAAGPRAAGSLQRQVTRLNATGTERAGDAVSIEEPLEIRLSFSDGQVRREQSVAVTMRTPGADEALATGFLAGEAIIGNPADIRRVEHSGPPSPDKGLRNVLRVELEDWVRVDLEKLKRHFYTSSSCGVCGKASLAAIAHEAPARERSGFSVSASKLRQLPAALRERQCEFTRTGGLHAAASFDAKGRIRSLHEDVGRHNALDKLVGSCFREGGMSGFGVLLSGRASFELIQKAAMAGVGLVAAIGAPSSLAIELAEQEGITLIGFLKASGFNLYCHEQRVLEA